MTVPRFSPLNSNGSIYITLTEGTPLEDLGELAVSLISRGVREVEGDSSFWQRPEAARGGEEREQVHGKELHDMKIGASEGREER